jgi:hypothetical protein
MSEGTGCCITGTPSGEFTKKGRQHIGAYEIKEGCRVKRVGTGRGYHANQKWRQKIL